MKMNFYWQCHKVKTVVSQKRNYNILFIGKHSHPISLSRFAKRVSIILYLEVKGRTQAFLLLRLSTSILFMSLILSYLLQYLIFSMKRSPLFNTERRNIFVPSLVILTEFSGTVSWKSVSVTAVMMTSCSNHHGNLLHDSF